MNTTFNFQSACKGNFDHFSFSVFPSSSHSLCSSCLSLPPSVWLVLPWQWEGIGFDPLASWSTTLAFCCLLKYLLSHWAVACDLPSYLSRCSQAYLPLWVGTGTTCLFWGPLNIPTHLFFEAHTKPLEMLWIKSSLFPVGTRALSKTIIWKHLKENWNNRIFLLFWKVLQEHCWFTFWQLNLTNYLWKD